MTNVIVSRHVPIRYGARARLGLILPSANVAAEPQISTILPEGVSLHSTRIGLAGSSLEELLDIVDKVSEAAALLSDADVNLIAFHCTAASTISKTVENSLIQNITNVTGRDAATTSQAIIASLRALAAERIVLVTPYSEQTNRRATDFFSHHGIQVLETVGRGLLAVREMITIEPDYWRTVVRRHAHIDADAYFISGTAVRSLEVIEELEAELRRPVITSNQALAWYALRRLGIRDRLRGFGRLLAKR
jgi:maleate isomerase